MSLIHVIIPCYNVENYLERAVESVLDQPFKDIDIILVDDGSPGRTPQLCEEIAARETRVHVLHKPNGGLSDARNAGIEYALHNLVRDSGELLAFLDGDDIWSPGALDDDVAQHLQTDWSEDVIGFSGVLANNTLDRFSSKLSTLELSNVDARSVMWHSHAVTVAAKLYRVSMFQIWNIRFLDKQLYTEDKIFMTQFYFLADKARFVNRTLHVYRKNRAGIMSGLQKLSAADHYLPIVDGWLKCDAFLNSLYERTQTTAMMGQTLAVTYLVEMVAEHIKQGRNMKDIMNILEKHPHYPAVRDGSLVRSSAAVYKDNRLLFEQPKVFAAKYRAVGIVEKIIWKVFTIPVITRLWERKRYPFTEIPV